MLFPHFGLELLMAGEPGRRLALPAILAAFTILQHRLFV